MGPALPSVLGIALVQGLTLHGLHRLAESSPGAWPELSFLLPAYACTVGIPLTYYLLHTQLDRRMLARCLGAVGLTLAGTAAYVGWVNGPVGDLRPARSGTVLLFGCLTVLVWFVALPFLRLGFRGIFTPRGYAALFDEAWRLAITLAFAAVFVGLLWGLLGLFVGLFEIIDVRWPKEIVSRRYFYYPVTCAAASFAIGLTDVKPEMFRALRNLHLGVLRWLSVLASAIVLLFLGTVVVEGVDVLWKTRFATWALIALAVALVTLYNTVYQDGGQTERLPRPLGWLVRAALAAGPALAGLAFWALALRLRQHGVSEDRIYALLVVTIVAGYLVGYCMVALLGGRAPFEVRQVNVVMALVTIGVLLSVHSPILDLKRFAVRSQLARLADVGERFDFHYLRHDAGRHGILALQALSGTGDPAVAAQARSALAEVNRRELGAFAQDRPGNRDRFRSRIDVYPRGTPLPEDLVDRLFVVYEKQRWQLACIDSGVPCAALLIDLDGDGQAEAVVLSQGQATAYARLAGGWSRVGQLTPGQYRSPEELRKALEGSQWRTAQPPAYASLEIGAWTFTFVPDRCDAGQPGCP
jgi:uncharacterized protein DUF4153